MLINLPDPLRIAIRDARRALSPTQGLHALCQKFSLSPWDVLALEEEPERKIHLTKAKLKQLRALLETLHPQQTVPLVLRSVDEREEPEPMGDYLRNCREALKATNPRYSLRQVAERVGLQPISLSQIENNKRPPSEETLYYLADEYQLNVDGLLAQAGLVARDVMHIVRERPERFARLIRALERTSDERIDEIIDDAVRGKRPRKSADAPPAPASPTPSETPPEAPPGAQTDAPTERYADPVHGTLLILETGHYAVDGHTISIAKALEHARANTVTHRPGSLPMPPPEHPRRDTRIEVTPTFTLDALQALVHRADRGAGPTPVVLNFADAYEPSADFRSGYLGQEQSLQRASGLVACLESDHAMAFYEAHGDGHADAFHSDHLIYSPEVPVFRDAQGGLLQRPYSCAFISATAVLAARLASERSDQRDRIAPVMYQRIRQILACAWHHGHSTLVLGAWGCGVYGNSATLIAQLFHDALHGDFEGVFERIVFAVPKLAGSSDLDAFRTRFAATASAHHPLNLFSMKADRAFKRTPDRPLFTPELLDSARQHYRELRRELCAADPEGLKAAVSTFCTAANPTQYASPAPQAREHLWHHLWVTQRELGVLPGLAAQEIADLSRLFDDYRPFSDDCWDINTTGSGRRLEAKGECARHFINRTGNFADKHTDGSLLRLKQLVQLARDFKAYFTAYPEAEALHFLTDGQPLTDVSDRAIAARLSKLSFTDRIAQQRLMFRIGLPVLNPSLALARTFMAFGWWQELFPEAPRHLFPEALVDQVKWQPKAHTKHQIRQYHFSHPMVLRTLQAFVEELLAGLSATVLQADVGWVTESPMQEFMFLVEHYDRRHAPADIASTHQPDAHPSAQEVSEPRQHYPVLAAYPSSEKDINEIREPSPPSYVSRLGEAEPSPDVGRWNDQARAYYLGDDDPAHGTQPVRASAPFLTRYCSTRMRTQLRAADVSIDGVRHLIRQLTRLLPHLDHTVPAMGSESTLLLILGRASIQKKQVTKQVTLPAEVGQPNPLRRLTPVVRGMALGLCAIDGNIHLIAVDKLLHALPGQTLKQEWQPWDGQAHWSYHRQPLLDDQDTPIELAAHASLAAIIQVITDWIPEHNDKQRHALAKLGDRLALPDPLQLLVPRFADDDLALIDPRTTAAQESNDNA